MDLYDIITIATHDVQGPSTSLMNNSSTEIKDVLQQRIEGITSKVKAQSLRICKLEDCKRFEDEYASGLEILRAKFSRLRGSAENFTKLQENTLKALQEDTKTMQSKLNSVWLFLNRLSIRITDQGSKPIPKKEDSSSSSD